MFDLVSMTKEEFLRLLEESRKKLEEEAKKNQFKSSSSFEKRVREVLAQGIYERGLEGTIDFNPPAQAFPDICLGTFGVEVKFTEKDTWKGVGNSISQGMMDDRVTEIYLIWCKAGGEPKVATRLYEDAIYHVRTSHLPRFEIDMQNTDSWFEKIKIKYSEFSNLFTHQRMDLFRAYTKGKLRQGLKQYYWHLETQVVDVDGKTNMRLFDELSDLEKNLLFHEEVLLVPQLMKYADREFKFDERILHFYNKHQVLYPSRLTLYDQNLGSLKDSINLETMRKKCQSIDMNIVRSFWTFDNSTHLSSQNLWNLWLRYHD